jgi:hypothetical protein
MKTYILNSDAGKSEVQANSAEEALEALNITEAQIEDGAWAWAEAKDGTEEREYIARENMC